MLVQNCRLIAEANRAGGLLYVAEWNSLQHPVASAFLANVYNNYMATSGKSELTCSGKSFTTLDLRMFAKSQTDYVLGDNPMKLSYLVGFSDKLPAAGAPPRRVHPRRRRHRLQRPRVAQVARAQPERRHGRAGRRAVQERLVHRRQGERTAEPTTYNSALVVGLLSGLLSTAPVAKSLS